MASQGATLSNNWLSTRPDVLDYEARVEPWEYYTPSKQYADLTMLNHLPPADVELQYELGANDDDVRVELTNRSDRIAFFIELLLTEPDTGRELQAVTFMRVITDTKKLDTLFAFHPSFRKYVSYDKKFATQIN